jgi:DNA-binding LacI/PurR family transcriptional regulator
VDAARVDRCHALVCGNDVMAIGARDAAIRLLKLQVPGDLAIVGQDGIAMAGWECNDLTTLALDRVALIVSFPSLPLEPRPLPPWRLGISAQFWLES